MRGRCLGLGAERREAIRAWAEEEWRWHDSFAPSEGVCFFGLIVIKEKNK
jgi:hypothetical protein